MLKQEITKQEIGTTFAPFSVSLQERDTDILILHFKNKMNVNSLCEIFTISEQEVNRIISTFAEQFSNIDNLNNVVDGFIRMKETKRRKAPSEDISPEMAAKNAEIAELKRLLTQAEIKAEVFEELVNVAEKTFNIPIRKKLGAK